ncbi:MAG: TadE/TadG family type IV pilus assembly protein [Pseudomonadota bacterium]
MAERGHFRSAVRGNVAVAFALIGPLLAGLVGAGVDYARFVERSAAIQEFSDAAALAGARQFALTGRAAPSGRAKPHDQGGLPSAVARNLAENLLAGAGMSGAVSAQADFDGATVTVEITSSYEPTLLVSMFERPLTVHARSEAVASSAGRICVIATDERQRHALHVKNNGRIIGQDCGIFVNSDDVRALNLTGGASVEASLICVVGGSQVAGTVSPGVLEGCPPKDNPITEVFAHPGSILPCMPDSEFHGGAWTLYPGHYCNGISIDSATVELQPGVYHITGGDFDVIGVSHLVGDGAVIVFGVGSTGMLFDRDTSIDLTAPVAGDYAGILMYQVEGAGRQTYTITSDDARRLLGTVYLPDGIFVVDTNAPVAQESAFTAIIAEDVDVFGNSTLVLNSDYESTDVPAAPGIRGEVSVRLRN